MGDPKSTSSDADTKPSATTATATDGKTGLNVDAKDVPNSSSSVGTGGIEGSAGVENSTKSEAEVLELLEQTKRLSESLTKARRKSDMGASNVDILNDILCDIQKWTTRNTSTSTNSGNEAAKMLQEKVDDALRQRFGNISSGPSFVDYKRNADEAIIDIQKSIQKDIQKGTRTTTHSGKYYQHLRTLTELIDVLGGTDKTKISKNYDTGMFEKVNKYQQMLNNLQEEAGITLPRARKKRRKDTTGALW